MFCPAALCLPGDWRGGEGGESVKGGLITCMKQAGTFQSKDKHDEFWNL